MAKELTHRAAELKDLGWSVSDINRYIDLWDYRQRWGAINLEREDRQFLRKAESALPVIKVGKPSIKKPITEKSYFRRIASFLETMNLAESEFASSEGDRGIWPILLEEELRTLSYFQPVLGLPDTLKSKAFTAIREEIILSALNDYKESISNIKFNFSSLLASTNPKVDKNWKPLREIDYDSHDDYPMIKKEYVTAFRKEVRSKTILMIKSTFPSLSDTDKPDPPDDWIPELDS